MTSSLRKLLIFDMDGTLIDSMPFLRGLGIEFISLFFPEWSHKDATAHYDRTVGLPFQQQLHALGPHQPVLVTYTPEQIAALYQRIHLLAEPLFRLTSLGRELAAFPRSEYPHVQLALVSSTHEMIVKQSGIGQAIQFQWISGFDGDKRNKMTQIIDACQKLGFKAGDVTYCGDTEHDYKTAVNLRLMFFEHTTSLSKMLHSLEALERPGAFA